MAAGRFVSLPRLVSVAFEEESVKVGRVVSCVSFQRKADSETEKLELCSRYVDVLCRVTKKPVSRRMGAERRHREQR